MNGKSKFIYAIPDLMLLKIDKINKEKEIAELVKRFFE